MKIVLIKSRAKIKFFFFFACPRSLPLAIRCLIIFTKQ